MTVVDPGGTFGAEVAVTVVGRGRVTGSIANGIDCPSRCYVRYTFTDPTAPGAAAGLGLKAIATRGARFTGWTFETEALGTKGRGPDSCNPIKRAASQPSVDSAAAEINLAFGQTTGTPPPGQEGACGGDFSTVPLAYKLVARFEDDAQPLDAGPEGGDGGDGGTGDIVFEATPAGSVAKNIGIVSGYVYWRWEQGSSHGISYGFASSPTSATSIASPGTSITQFEVDQNNVVYQTSTNSLYVIQGGGTTSTPMTGATSYTCAAVTSDFSNVFCRTAGPDGSILGWTTAGTGPVSYQTGLPTGTDLVVDTSYFYFSDNASGSAGSLYRVLRSIIDSDAGPGSWTTLVTGRSNMRELEQNSLRNAWLEYDLGADTGSAWSTSSKTSTIATQNHPPTTGLRFLAVDPSSSTTMWYATQSTIFRGSTSSSVATPFRTGLTNIGGIAVDSSYVYWTQSDGRVYRASKF